MSKFFKILLAVCMLFSVTTIGFGQSVKRTYSQSQEKPFVVGQGYGKSRYDKGIMTIDEAMDIKKVRIRKFEDSFEGKLLSSGVLGIVGWVMFLAIKQSL